MFKIILIMLASIASAIGENQVQTINSSQDIKDIPGHKIPENLDKVKSIEISKIWARPSLAANNNSALYFDINNTTDTPLVLIGAVAEDVANNVEIHKSFVDDKGISKMTPIDKLVIPAHSIVSFAPGGIHIMLNNLKTLLKEGDKFNVELNFQDRNPIKFEAIVKSNN